MTTNAIYHDHRHHAPAQATDATRFLVPLGRLLFVAIFLASGPNHFKSQMIEHASKAGVPMANLLVPAAGVIAMLGGLSVLLGFKARWGAWLLVIFLVPVTLAMHKFWGISDPAVAMAQQINFMKNVSMLGAALMVAHFGAGPISIDAHHHH